MLLKKDSWEILVCQWQCTNFIGSPRAQWAKCVTFRLLYFSPK